MSAAERSTEDLVEAFHLAHAVWALHDTGVLDAFREPCPIDEVAVSHRFDVATLRDVCAYVAERTDLLERDGERFVTTAAYSRGSRFLLDLYAGAYGPTASRLPAVLARPSLGAKSVDRAAHARAFSQPGPAPPVWLASVVAQLEWNHVLDLGCGTATMLLQLAERDPAFTGWGLDANRAMCRAARARLREAGVAKRVKIVHGDVRHPERVSDELRSAVGTVTARQVANEMFGAGPDEAVAWLGAVRRAFPGRPLLIEDYYGVLGTGAASDHPATLLHDYVQRISGQGVPPSSLAEWQRIYEPAGCRLIHVSEDTSSTRFVHIVMLGEAGV